MNVLIIILGIILLFGLLYYEKKNDRKPLLIVKSILSLLFVITALLQPHSVPAYYHYLFIGLIFCFIGDVCLALPQEKAFMGGLVAFLIGHIFYIFSFSSLTQIYHWISAGFFIIFGMSALIFLWLRPHLKSMLIPVLLYILVITVMASGAWAVFWKSSFPNFRKGTHLSRVPLFLLLRCFCRPEQVHKRGIPKSAPRLATLLHRSILAGLFCRPDEVR